MGAFAAFYFLEFQESPPYPDPKSVEFRNDVIHRGKIPKQSEVADYGDRIVKFLVPVYRKYRNGFEALTATGIERVTELQKEKRNEKLSASSGYPTAISDLALREEEPSFGGALEYVRKNKGRFFTP